MNLQYYLEKLKKSPVYADFVNENPDAYLCGGFFILDYEKEDESEKDKKAHLDVYVPSLQKMFSFDVEVDKEVNLIPVEMFENAPVPEKIIADSSLEFEKIHQMIENEMSMKSLKNKIQKIIIVLQNSKEDGKDYWICTVFISGLGLLKVHIDDSAKRITHFEKKSFFDMVGFMGKKKKD